PVPRPVRAPGCRACAIETSAGCPEGINAKLTPDYRARNRLGTGRSLAPGPSRAGHPDCHHCTSRAGMTGEGPALSPVPLPEVIMSRRAVSLTGALASGVLLLAACSETATEPRGMELTNGVSANVAATSVSVVMSNLDAPRQMAWGPEGGLYVVEAGNTAINGPCAAIHRGNNCYSGTGAITRLWKGTQERVAEGLPSAFNPAVNDISGPQDISFQGRGNARLTIGWGSDPDHRAQLGEQAVGFGLLLQLRPDGSWRPLADVSA